MPEIRYETETKMIACVLPKGRGRPLQQALVDQKDIITGTFHYGRGIGRESHIRDRGIGEQQEREVFEVVVPAERAEEIFEFIFTEAGMGEPHGGMIYMTRLPRSTIMTLPELPEEE
jgi:nitrogen regulatory protein PII